ncbi:hypothetical protein EGJ52_24615 [Pseudomonas luteola]|nr:hypothetical protein EGJ52_24615 [Pseudomonas luteola]
MDLIPIERGQQIYRERRGLPPKYHARLKHKGKTLVILQGDSEQEVQERAQRLIDVLFSCEEDVTIEHA